MSTRHWSAVVLAVVVGMPMLTPTVAARAQTVVTTESGATLFRTYCASCHGADAQGAPDWQQPDARGDLPAPPHDDSGHTWRHPDAQLTQIIRDGLRDQFNKTPELTMPPFGPDQLSDQDIADVITYFKSLWSLEHRQFQEQQNLHPTAPGLSPNPAGGG